MKERTLKEIFTCIGKCVQDGDSIRVINGEVIVTNALGAEVYREYYK